ncbi:MAG: lipopolysaccharide biosynthesis protein [Solirubrobacteraceae bacterium]|nr:lipopolysaccharide biosynthesis protein [Solirubrobacteraceae bacterium]
MQHDQPAAPPVVADGAADRDGMAVGSRADEVLGGDASGSIVRGAAVRGVMFVGSTGLIALAFAFVFRAVGVDAFGDLAVAIAIATIVQNAGDTAVAAIAMRTMVAADASERVRLHAQLVGLRLVVMPPLIAVGVLFALAVYDSARSEMTLVICLSTLVAAVAAALIMPLNVELRAGRASVVDFVRQVVIAVGLMIGAAVSAPILGYAAVYLVAATAGLIVAVFLIDPDWRRIRMPERETVRTVARQASWLALALTVNSLFLKVLTVIASLATTKTETGLFAAATRVTEVVAALSLMVASVAYPLLSRAADEQDWPRFANAVQRLLEGVMLLAGAAAVVLIVAARPLMEIFAGAEFSGAAPVLQYQAVALTFAATTQALVWALLALHDERALVVTNLVGLGALSALGALLVGAHGAMGAAYAGIGGEALLLTVTLAALARRRRDALPAIQPTLTTIALGAACVGLGLALPIPELLAALVAVGLFGGGALLLRLVPTELLSALPGRQAAANTNTP